MYKTPQQAFSPHISRGYTAQQNSQPVKWVPEPLWPASIPCLSHGKPSIRSSVDAMACTTTCLSAAQLASGMVRHALSDPTASHCETGLVSRGLLGLLASWSSLSSRSRAGGPAAAEACAHLGRCLADGLRAAWFLLPQPCGGKEAPARRPVVRVAGSNGRLPLREGYLWPYPSVTPQQAPKRPTALGGR